LLRQRIFLDFSRLLAEVKFERFLHKQKQSVRRPEIIETPIRLPARFTNGGVDWIYGGKLLKVERLLYTTRIISRKKEPGTMVETSSSAGYDSLLSKQASNFKPLPTLNNAASLTVYIIAGFCQFKW
jgi:hypothetical protein